MIASRVVKSNRVSSGRCVTPAVITTTFAPLQSAYSPARTIRLCLAYGKPCCKSIASPIAFSLLTSIKTSSSKPPVVKKLYAILIPTEPVPTSTIFLVSFILIPLIKLIHYILLFHEKIVIKYHYFSFYIFFK
ncbi:hypothetical protein SDC9_209238 [bioreactor metagenome]|uniref:Uncharacterized protein n=1 Tax=bioreactor metagenome TaxID=1076179 RepID=A0A645JEH3_9ZZZZ